MDRTLFLTQSSIDTEGPLRVLRIVLPPSLSHSQLCFVTIVRHVYCAGDVVIAPGKLSPSVSPLVSPVRKPEYVPASVSTEFLDSLALLGIFMENVVFLKCLEVL